MDNLYTTKELVQQILENDKQARNSDNYLYYQVCKIVGKQNGIDIESMPIPRFFLNMKEYGFPCFESVRRTRQKLQASFPELAACSNVEAMRMVKEEEYRDFARRKW